MDLAAPLPELETAALVVGARPTTVAHGQDISPWVVGGRFALLNCTAYIKGDGADCAVTSPAGGIGGVEVWMFKTNKAGTSKWFLVGYLNNGTDVPITDASGGFAQVLEGVGIGSRLALAGTPTGGRSPTCYFEPIEHAVDARRM